MTPPALIINEFDAARQAMLQAFQRLARMDGETAVVEAMATEQVLHGLLVLEGAVEG